MILRLPDRGMADVEVTVDPIVVTQADGTRTVGPPGELITADAPAPKQELPWAWLIFLGLAGLAVGWWLAQEDRRGGGPSLTP